MNMRKQIRGSIMLLIAAIIWGSAFVAQSEGMEYVEPFTFASVRFFIASVSGASNGNCEPVKTTGFVTLESI